MTSRVLANIGAMVLAFLIIAAMSATSDTTLDMEKGYPDDLVIYEDGSGYSESTGREWDENTFRWDCATMGNKRC